MEISALIQRAQSGDDSARQTLIEENLGLVRHIVKRFAGRGYDAEDLFQTGTIGPVSYTHLEGRLPRLQGRQV